MKILLEQNHGPNQGVVPYVARTQVTIGFPFKKTLFDVPIYFQHLRDRSFYRANVCGISIEAKTPDKVVKEIKRLLPGLMHKRQLPTYVFIARHARQVYPVYTAGDKVFATTVRGPMFRHVELAKVREYLTDYLHEIGELWVPGNRDHLHVRGINPKSLEVIRPLFYLKKRPQATDEHEFWAPVFPSVDESAIYTFAASTKHEIEIEAGREVFRLHARVAQALIADNRLQAAFDLRIDRLLPHHWQQMQRLLTPEPCHLICPVDKLDVYRADQFLVAVEYRSREDRYSLFCGSSLDDLRRRVARDFVRRGLITDPELVTKKVNT